MKQVHTLLADLSMKKVPDDSGKECSPGREGDDGGKARDTRDHVDAVNQMFAEFELAYHNQFHKAYAAEGSVALAKKYWLSCLAPYPPRVILRATREVIKRQAFLPAPAAIVAACEDAELLFGLPSPREAYVEACCAPRPQSKQRWSHPAVYHAGRASGWFLLATEPEAKALPLFEYHYRLLCRRVMQGEDLDVQAPRALPEKAGRDLSPEENKERLRELRENLKL